MTEPCLGTETLIDFIEGRANLGVRAHIEGHASRCDECRKVLSSLARGSETSGAAVAVISEPPARVGRYVIARELGRGGMGIVYAAHDPELDRTVAVKVLRGGGDAAMQARLRREAQSMAQLAHPNVVAVHDVGSFGEDVFVAMEYVAGETLARWERTPRAPREILEAYRAAGRGLAAAHAAGIVHRDFKPENVLMGDDGRVRVVDFGLARTAGTAETTFHGHATSVSPDGPTTPAGLTQTGAVVGTPFYMAPEIFQGGEADARSDQFSFCVALFTALYGERPFAGDSLAELGANIAAGRISEPATTRRVPRRVRTAIRRGLALDPTKRFAAIEDLLAELAPLSRRARWLAVGVGVIAIASAAVGVAFSGTAPPSCGSAADSWSGIWDAPRRVTVAAALLRTGAPYAGTTWREVESTFDRYAERWESMHVGVCEATRIRGDQSEEVMDLRMACLDQRLHALDGLATTFASADRAILQQAVVAAQDLPSIAGCGDVAALTSPLRPPNPGTKIAVEGVRRELAMLDERRSAGATEPALPAARKLLAQATALGYRPLEAEVLTLVGRLERDGDDFSGARVAFERSVLAGEAGRHDRQVVTALIELIGLVGKGLGKPQDVPAIRERASALLERIDHPPMLEAQLLQAGGEHDISIGELAAAERNLSAGLALSERLYGRDDLHLVTPLRALAKLELSREHGKEARELLDRVLAIQLRVLGADHPDVALTLNMLGGAEMTMQHDANAEAFYLRSQAIYERSVGADSLAIANVLDNLAALYQFGHKVKQSIAAHRRAIEITTRKLGPSHPVTLSYQSSLAVALEDDGQPTEALELLTRVLAEQRKQLGSHQTTALTIQMLANVELANERYADARDHALEAYQMFRQVLGEHYVPYAELGMLGGAYLGLGEPGKACDAFEQARRELDDSVDPGAVAWLEAQLGVAMILAKRDPARGRALVLKAAKLIAADDRMLEERDQLARWMKQLRIPPP